MPKKANTQKPRCPKCKGGWTYFRIYRDEWYCRDCQYTWKPDKMKEEAGNAASLDSGGQRTPC